MGGLDEGGDFDIGKSLKYGAPTFMVHDFKNFEGGSVGNALLISKDTTVKTYRHELVHNHQYSSSIGVGALVMNATGLTESNEEVYPIRIESIIGHLTLALPEHALLRYEDRPSEREAYTLTNDLKSFR